MTTFISFLLLVITYKIVKSLGYYDIPKRISSNVDGFDFFYFIFVMLIYYLLPLSNAYSRIFSMPIFFLLVYIHHKIRSKLLLPPCGSSTISLIFKGVINFFVAVPWVLFTSACTTYIVENLFGIAKSQQIVVLIENATGAQLYALLLIVVIYSPIVEEFFFRGLLQPYLGKFMNSKISISLTAILFSLLHLSIYLEASNIITFFSLLPFAAHLGIVTAKSSSIVPAIISHMLFNLINIVELIT